METNLKDYNTRASGIPQQNQLYDGKQRASGKEQSFPKSVGSIIN